MRCAVFSVTFLIFTSLWPSQPAFASPFDRVLPEGALLYWGNEGYTSPIGQFPNYQQADRNWHLLFDDILEYRVLHDELNAVVAKSGVAEGFSAVGGDRRCFAIYPLLEGTALPGIGIYIAEVKDATAADRLLTTLFEEITTLIPGFRTLQDEYYGYWIRTLYGPMILPGTDLTYAFKDSLFMISNSKSMLLRTIDRMEDGDGFLADEKVYQEAIAPLPPDRKTTFFINSSFIGKSNSALLDNLKALQQLNVSNDLQKILPILNGINTFFNAFQSYASTWSVDSAGRVTTECYTRLNLALEDGTLKTIINRPPVPFQFEKYLPRKVGTVTSGNILGPKDLWALANSYLSVLPPVQEFLNKISQLEKENGFSIQDDLFGWMGDSWCLLRPVMDLETIVASNQLALFLQVTDTNAAENGIQKLVNRIQSSTSNSLLFQEEPYRNTTIHSLTLPVPLLPVAPSWCIDGATLMVATKPEILREMLDIAAGNQTGIDRNRQYRELREAALVPANKITFQDNESEFYAYREAMRKVASLPEVGHDLPPALQVLPQFILDRAAYWMSCWQVLRGTVKQTVLQDDCIVTHKVRLYGDLRAVPPLDSVNRLKLSVGAKDWIALWADSLQKHGDSERALRLYRTLSEFFPQNGDYLSHLGNIYKSQSNFPEALNVYNRLLQQSPKTAYLIGREMLYDNATADEIVGRVRATALTTTQIDENAALFGIALAKRQANDFAIASALNQKVAQSETATASMKQSAAWENEILGGKIPKETLAVPETAGKIVIDGSLNEEAWSRAAQFEISCISDETVIPVRLIRDRNNLYVSLQGQGVPISTLFRFGPDRDYTHFVEIVSREGDSPANMAIEHRTLDPYNIAMDSNMLLEMNDWFSSSNAGHFKETLHSILLGIGQDDLTQWDSLFQSEAPIPMCWKSESNKPVLEMAIPLDILRSPLSQPVWLFNLIYTFHDGAENVSYSLSGMSNPDDPFACRWVRMQ